MAMPARTECTTLPQKKYHLDSLNSIIFKRLFECHLRISFYVCTVLYYSHLHLITKVIKCPLIV